MRNRISPASTYTSTAEMHNGNKHGSAAQRQQARLHVDVYLLLSLSVNGSSFNFITA